MKLYSASEALRPAWLRTYSYLFQSFKWEVFLKLATVATVSEGFVVSWKFLAADSLPFDVDLKTWFAFLLKPAFLPVTFLGTMAIFLAGVYCIYLVTRLRFAFVHSLIHQTRSIGNAVKLYPLDAERFFAASVVVWLVFLMAGVAALLVIFIAGFTVMETPTTEGKLDPGNFFLLFVPCFGLVVALFLAACVAQVVLNDFILPHMAIEGVPFKKAWSEVRARIGANKETFLSFFILRLAIPLVAGIVLALMAWGAGLLVFGILSMSAAGFTAMLDGSTGIRAYLLIAIRVLFILLGLGAGWVIAASLGGPLGVFLRSYALYYYGGHYKVLGNLLEPPTPPTALPEPATKK